MTKFMMIRSRQRLKTFSTIPSLIIDNASINQVASTKSLGVYVDENLSWNVHIDKIASRDCFWHWYLEEKSAFCFI